MVTIICIFKNTVYLLVSICESDFLNIDKLSHLYIIIVPQKSPDYTEPQLWFAKCCHCHVEELATAVAGKMAQWLRGLPKGLSAPLTLDCIVACISDSKGFDDPFGLCKHLHIFKYSQIHRHMHN